MTEVFKWRLYCETEETQVYTGWQEDAPNACPNNAQHVIDEESIVATESRDLDVQQVEQKGFRILDGYNVYWKGYRFKVARGEIVNFDVSYDVIMKLQGIAFRVVRNARDWDYIEVDVVDKDGNVFPAGTVLVGFADTIYTHDGMEFKCICEDAKDLYAWAYLRFRYVAPSSDPLPEPGGSSSSSATGWQPAVVVQLDHIMRTCPE